VEIALLRPALYQAAALRDAGGSAGEMAHRAAMLKLFASEALGRAADRAVQIHGGMGYMRDCAVEHLYREARMMRIVEGTSEIQRMIIARHLLAE
jgi:acyl-CoA dehydrogenase